MTRLSLAALLCLAPAGAFARHAPGDSIPCEAGFCQGEKIVRWYKASREIAFATIRGFSRPAGQLVFKVWRSAGGEEWWPARAILGHASGRGTRYAAGDRVVIKRDEGLKGRYHTATVVGIFKHAKVLVRLDGRKSGEMWDEGKLEPLKKGPPAWLTAPPIDGVAP